MGAVKPPSDDWHNVKSPSEGRHLKLCLYKVVPLDDQQGETQGGGARPEAWRAETGLMVEAPKGKGQQGTGFLAICEIFEVEEGVRDTLS